MTAAPDMPALRMLRQARDRIDRDYAEPVGCELTNDLTLDNSMRWLTVRPQGSNRRVVWLA